MQEASTDFQNNHWGSSSDIKRRTEPGDSSVISGKTYRDLMDEVGTGWDEKLRNGYNEDVEKEPVVT